MVESSRYSLDRIFQALADPTRRAILRRVSTGPSTVGEIARPFRMSLAAVSKHLGVLERARLVSTRKRGSFRHVSLNAEALLSAGEWIAHYRRFWNERLDSLKDLIEREDL